MTLLVSEMVTNAVLHAGTEVVLRIGHEGSSVRVEVTDGCAAMPGVRQVSDESATGRGMWLVQELADAWGQQSREDGQDHGLTRRIARAMAIVQQQDVAGGQPSAVATGEALEDPPGVGGPGVEAAPRPARQTEAGPGQDRLEQRASQSRGRSEEPRRASGQ